MIKKILTGVAIAMLVVGIGLVAFPPISNFIGTQISNGEADGFDTRVEEAEDGSFEQAVKDGKVDEEGYKIDRDGKRTSKQPVVFKADLDRLFNDSVAYNKKLETNQYEMLRNDTYSQAAVKRHNRRHLRLCYRRNNKYASADLPRCEQLKYELRCGTYECNLIADRR